MKKKIAIIGASYLQVPLILKAKTLGLETHCFAWEDGAIGKEFSDFFYPISIFQDVLVSKSNKILLVFAKTKGERKTINEKFHFTEAYLHGGVVLVKAWREEGSCKQWLYVQVPRN